jgi:hypothetical protein
MTSNKINSFYNQTMYGVLYYMWPIEMHVFVSHMVYKRSLLRKGCTVEIYCTINYPIIVLFSVVSDTL